MLHIMFKGIVIGLITGMPLGPIGALCMRTTLANGALFGLAAGLGSCIADSLYAGIAAMGIGFIAKFLFKYQKELHLFGGIILILFGFHIVHSKKEQKEEIPSSKTLAKSFLTTFTLALANPSTIFSFLVVFSGYGSKNIGHGANARAILILGVFLGSLLWWIILILAAGKLQHKLHGENMTRVNKVLGYIIVFSGIALIFSPVIQKRQLRGPLLHLKLFEKFLNIKAHGLFKMK